MGRLGPGAAELGAESVPAPLSARVPGGRHCGGDGAAEPFAGSGSPGSMAARGALTGDVAAPGSGCRVRRRSGGGRMMFSPLG